MSDSSPPTRPIFDPVDTSFDPNDVTARDHVESPSLSSGNALARFEFEPGKSKEGTKVLMVEWEEDDTTKAVHDDWEISWEGKKTVLPAREQTGGGGEGEAVPLNRLYFLLGSGVNIPTTVKLRKGAVVWKTNPLPAIFSPELGATARQAGKKGVLHTIWAKKRLQVLQAEIENESKTNVEGVALEMASAEQAWIEKNFGVVTKPGSMSIVSGSGNTTNSPTSPRSPGGGRLMDKLKGLKVGTSDQDLQPTRTESHNPLSPETADVAVGSFSSFAAIKGMPATSTMGAKPSQRLPVKKITPQAPPASVVNQQSQQPGMASLNAFANNETESPANVDAGEKQDDLFALPMSPRNAGNTGTSAFSFDAKDTSRYVRGETA